MSLRDMARQRFWTINEQGRRMATWDFGGQGPLALLHHANGLCAAAWAPVAVQLSEHYRVIALDARGHGDSDAGTVPDDFAWHSFVDDLIALARQVLAEVGDSSVAHGIGSSFGGIITAAAAAREPALFQRVSMLDPPIHLDDEERRLLDMEDYLAETERRVDLAAMTLKRRSVFEDRAAAAVGWRSKPLFAPWCQEAFDLYVQEGLKERADGQVELKCAPEVEAHIFATTGSLRLMDYAPNVQVPVQVVHAAQGYFPEAFFRVVARQFPQGTFAQLPAGHMLPLEVPDQVVEQLMTFAR